MSPFFFGYSLRPANILLFILLCSIIGCDSSSSIAGKWRNSNDASAVIWEFHKDGSILIGNTRGRYSFGNDRRIKIETPFATSVYRMEVSQDRITLTDPNGSRLEFTKLK